MIEVEPQKTEEDLRIGILNALGLSLQTKRLEAMAARAASGIEDEWIGDEEFYAGYDDANRHEFTKSASKPVVGGGSSDAPVKRRGSTVFPNITQPYVDAAAARVGDMLLPTDDRNFALEATAIPDMLPEDAPPDPVQRQAQGQPQPETPRLISLPDGTHITVEAARQKFDAYKAEAARKAEKAQTRIDDWHGECQLNAEVRKVIDDAARIGSGVLKGPVPVMRKSRQWRQTDTGSALILVEEIKPASFRIDPWNLFPDGACGESIHNGAYIFERDYLTPKKLGELKGIDGYLSSQIDLCIEEGPLQGGEQNRGAVARETKGQFEVWYFHGVITKDELEAAGVDCADGRDEYPVMLTLVNDHVIRAALNPLDSGDFPYDLIPWKRRQGMPWGMGVGRQMRTPQRIVVAATRNMMDNAGQGAGPQFVIRRGVEPVDGRWEISPLKLWRETDDSDGQSGPPFLSVIIPMLQVELGNIIQMGMKMAEDVTGMPMLMQGNQGSAPDTVGGMTILNNNSNSVLRRIARLFDSCITEPHVRRYYAWLMEYGEDNDEKGDFQVIARGSTALVERDIQSREMVSVVQMSINPAFGIDPKKAVKEYLKSRRFDPAAFEYTEEEQAKMDAQPPMPPPQIAVAQIRAQAEAQKTDKVLAAEQQIAQLENQTEQTRIKVDTDRDLALVNAQHEKNSADAQARMAELQVKLQLAQLDYASKHQITVEQLKTKLAETTMKLHVTKELAHVKASSDLMSKPPVEPAGRAENGQSYAQ